ncbi:amidase [Aurantimonas sp. C2-6-R+9]|uniref:amidase n=1 Tax=unclassified Aurantimonas TaxID=2638230 RepID=UPI002E197208|nr:MULTISPECIES: amidase [unclassified Aurantimonas]MEC5291172.1 amidase [Aurantimonas sp. C2-3-R2]MEC5381499.1 amidase [Aurantimonas sp. C2-6-R+9]MEC5411866.1 amidase [Aurantimonas sp. C2-4-R8]
MSHSSLPDWTGLQKGGRARQIVHCQAIAADLDQAFNLFVEREGGESANSDGILEGMPYAAKDMFDLPGRAPLFGLDKALSAPPQHPAEILRRLDLAGGHRIGLTRLTSIAYEPSGAGTALNPWNPEMAPGGSSSGSAAAVACGAAFVALGSDTGGSLRIPAHCCGVTAWKPSPDTIPRNGAATLAPSLDTIGLIARSARDILLTMDATHLLPPSGEIDAERAKPGIAIAVDIVTLAEPSVRSACEAGIAHLSGLGFSLHNRDAKPEIKRAGDAALRVLQGEAARHFAPSLDALSANPSLRRRLEMGLGVDDATLASDLAGRKAARQEFLTAVFGNCDFLALPVMSIRTPALTEVDPASNDFTPRILYALSAWTLFANYLGLPALALPTGFDDRNMPVALQIVGRPGSDRRLLALGAAFQAGSSWHGRMPHFAKPIIEQAERAVA